MATFDSSNHDIPTLVAKLADQRFDGYQPEQLARVVEQFRDGAGTTSITEAVEALRSISGALAGTEEALRTQLRALGVEWQSRAGDQASSVVAREAGFSAEATAKVDQAARMMFEQAEAFTRTRNKLPAPEDLRKAGSYDFGDTVFSLFGFETDHAADVRTAEEARAQAVDALNAYAHDSGGYLGATSTVEAPAPVDLLSAPGSGVVSGVGGAVPTVPDTSTTQAQGTKDVTPAVAPVDTPTPAMGVPAPGSAGVAAAGAAGARPGVTGPSGAVGAPAPGGRVAPGPGGAGPGGGSTGAGAAERGPSGGRAGGASPSAWGVRGGATGSAGGVGEQAGRGGAGAANRFTTGGIGGAARGGAGGAGGPGGAGGGAAGGAGGTGGGGAAGGAGGAPRGVPTAAEEALGKAAPPGPFRPRAPHPPPSDRGSRPCAGLRG